MSFDPVSYAMGARAAGGGASTANAIAIRGRGKNEVSVPRQVIYLIAFPSTLTTIGSTALFSILITMSGQAVKLVGVLDQPPEELDGYIGFSFSSHPMTPFAYIRAAASYDIEAQTLKLTSISRAGTEVINAIGSTPWAITIINPIIYKED